MRKNQSDKLVRKVFLSFAPVQALSVGLPGVNGLLNTLIVSSFIGVGALASVGFAAPLVSIIAAVSAVMASGAQILCGQYLGRGDCDRIRSTFTTALLMSTVIGTLFTVAGLLFSKEIALLLGTSGNATEKTARYILGLSPGFLFSFQFTCILPFLQIDDAKSTSTVAVVASLVASVACNMLNATVLKWDLLGVGLSTSAGNLVSVLIGLPHFMVGSKTYRFSSKGFSPKNMKNILRHGYPESANTVTLAIRDRVLNQVLFSLGGNVAMSAMTVASNITKTLLAINGGYAGSSSLVSCVLVGERDIQSLRNMTRTVFKSYSWIYYSVYAVLFILAKPIAHLFGAEPDKLEIYATAIRCINMWMLTNPLKEPPLLLYRSMGKITLASIFYILNGLLYPLLVMLVFRNNLTMLYAVPPLAEILLLVTYIFYYRIRARKWPHSLLNLTYVPDSFGVASRDRYSAMIQTMDEVTSVSEEMVCFCKDKQLSDRISMFCGLCFEEMAMNTLKHGFPEKSRNEYAVDVRMIYENIGISLMIRDNCPNFDPTEWLKMYSGDDPTHSIGIRLVSRLATKMEYSSTLGLNVMNIRLEASDRKKNAET